MNFCTNFLYQQVSLVLILSGGSEEENEANFYMKDDVLVDLPFAPH